MLSPSPWSLADDTSVFTTAGAVGARPTPATFCSLDTLDGEQGNVPGSSTVSASLLAAQAVFSLLSYKLQFLSFKKISR